MARERKKPEGSFIERAKNEIYYTDTTLIRGAYELGKRRGRKETIEKACEWLKNKVASFGYAECEDVWDATYIFDTNALIECFRKVMEE